MIFFSSKILIQLPFPVTTSFLETWNLFPLFLPAPLPFNFLNFSKTLGLYYCKEFWSKQWACRLPYIGNCIIFIFLSKTLLRFMFSYMIACLLSYTSLSSFVNFFFPIHVFSPLSMHVWSLILSSKNMASYIRNGSIGPEPSSAVQYPSDWLQRHVQRPQVNIIMCIFVCIVFLSFNQLRIERKWTSLDKCGIYKFFFRKNGF